MGTTQPAYRRAIIGTVVFSLFGIFGSLYFVHDWVLSLPLILTYAALIYDTFFSVRYFSTITPADDTIQKIFDVLLIICYAVIALNIANPLRFMYAMAVMFIFATGKYFFLRRRIGISIILARKIHVDIIGAVAYSLVTIPIFLGLVWQASWLLLILYIIANIQILWRNPLYPFTRA